MFIGLGVASADSKLYQYNKSIKQTYFNLHVLKKIAVSTIKESENDAIFNINDYCLEGKIVLLSRYDSRQSCERTAVVLDSASFSTSNRLLGGASASGKGAADILQQKSLKSEHAQLSNDRELINPLQRQYQDNTDRQQEAQNDKIQSQAGKISVPQQQKLQQQSAANNQLDTANAQGQKSVIKILLQEIGSGNYGTVLEILDLMNNTTRAEKTLRHKEDYEKEKQKYQKLEAAYTQEKLQLLSQLSILPDHFEDESLTIHFAAGQTSLYTLKKAKYFEFTDQQLVHIFSRLLEFMLLLGEQKYCHSHIKPEDITLVQVKGDRYLAKVVDFNQLEENTFTLNYFLNPMREYDSQNTMIFKNIDDRLKNEFLNIVRIMQRLMTQENRVSEDFAIDKDLMANNKQQYLDKMIAFWSKADLLSNRKSEEMQTIISFINNNVLNNNENYKINDLQELSKQLKQVQNYQELYGHFVDNNGTVSKIIKTKQQEAAGKETTMSQLFGLENFFYEKGSRNDDYSDDFKLLSEVKRVLGNSEQANKKRNLVLLGENGADNRLFVSKLMQDIFKDSEFNNNLIIFFKLRDLSSEKSTNQQLSRLLEHLKQENARYVQKERSILLFLEGFDELNNKQIAVDKALKNSIFGNKLTIVVTSRPRYAPYSDFLKCFGVHEVINICPFNKQQRDEYINQSVAVFKRLKGKITDFVTFDTAQEYIEVLEQQQSLKELAQVPSTLSLVLIILPKIKNEMIQSQKTQSMSMTKKFSKYQIYQILEQQFTQRELKRVLSIDPFKEAIYQRYDVQLFTDITKNKDKMNEFLEDLKLFHQFSCWKMLQMQKLKLNIEDIEQVTHEIKEIYEDKDFSSVAHIFIKIAPVQSSHENDLSYIHKSVQEFFVAQSVIEETLQSKQQTLEIKTSKLSVGFLAFNLDILCLLAEHLSELKLDEQYLFYCEAWYKTLLLTRKIIQDNITDKQEILKLERMGSNCMNLIASLPWIDLTDRDFSECAMPHAYLYKRDLTGSNNLRGLVSIITY